jgi:aminopeptidase N
MRTEAPVLVRLEDYQPSDYLIDTVVLDVHLHPSASTICADLTLRPHPQGRTGAKLVLDGDETTFIRAWLNGMLLNEADYEASAKGFTLHQPPQEPFVLRFETQVNPSANTQLSGLYRSNGVYCTQCEAEGFRRITYFLDRPDILSVYTTRIEACRLEAPVLLGNGNCVESGALAGSDRHYALWHDPHPKPCYLFALVGGDLDVLRSDFTTSSGRSVQLGIYVEKDKVGRADYAMDALKRSMIWDERVFHCEYDLDVFNIVAVSDFNMGAMENKGLNIFNDKYILASPETATDADYAAIEAIIAHEYFHNWTGNRITCRDWFQLCLKEGVTVFRDQEFSSDERSRAVHRIGEVRNLRARQFAEDAGPLAHSVRPRQYQEINNFYTATVYDKGAEIVRMLKTLIGDQNFAKGMKLYFQLCDGTAATVEDFLRCFAESSGRNLSHFAQWYEQAGTPQVLITGHYDPNAQTYRLDLAQSTAATPGQSDKEPMVLPIRLGLVGHNGAIDYTCEELESDGLYVMDRASASLVFKGVSSRPVPSVFRDFSAPVKVSLSLNDEDLMTLLRHDQDPFNRWQAGQSLMMRLLIKRVDGQTAPLEEFAASLKAFLEQESVHDPAFAALMLAIPGEGEMAQEKGTCIDPSLIHLVRHTFKQQLHALLLPILKDVRERLKSDEAYSPGAQSAGRRALRNMCLDGIAAADSEQGAALCLQHYEHATNMTDRMAAMTSIAQIKGDLREKLFLQFEQDYANEPLAMDKCYALQSTLPEEDVLERMEDLMQRPSFSWTNPNRLRSVVGSFAMNNPSQFNRLDGKGYAFLADVIIKIDPQNPQMASRLMTAFSTWRTMESQRQLSARQVLERIAATPNLSRDTDDIVRRSLKE